jgi:carboxylesterase
MNVLDLIPGAEPFFFQGGNVGCLLIHGFTATPNEVRGLGEYLAGQGYTVLGPRLAHHGSDPADMNRSRWHDWYLSALDGWHLLQGVCEQIVPVGMSMGGATALLLAARQPVTAVVSMSAPVYIPTDPRFPFLRAIGMVQPFLEKATWDESQRPSRYPVLPTQAVGELRQYLEVVEHALLAVTAPALLLHSRDDESVPPDSMERIQHRLGSLEKEMVWYEGARHVLTEDPEHRQDVYERVASFLKRWTVGP